MARIADQDQAIEEAPPGAGALAEAGGPSPESARPRSGPRRAPPGWTQGRRRSGSRAARARRPGPGRSPGRSRRRGLRPARRPSRARHRSGRARPGVPGGGRGPGSGTRSPPEGWSCRRRWRRSGPPAAGRSRGATAHRSGNRSGSTAAATPQGAAWPGSPRLADRAPSSSASAITRAWASAHRGCCCPRGRGPGSASRRRPWRTRPRRPRSGCSCPGYSER